MFSAKAVTVVDKSFVLKYLSCLIRKQLLKLGLDLKQVQEKYANKSHFNHVSLETKKDGR